MFDLCVREQKERNKRNIGTQALFQTGSSNSTAEAERRIKGPIYKLLYGNANPLFNCFKRKKCAYISSRSKTKRSRLECRNMDVFIQFLDEQSCKGLRSGLSIPSLVVLHFPAQLLWATAIWCNRGVAVCKYSHLGHPISQAIWYLTNAIHDGFAQIHHSSKVPFQFPLSCHSLDSIL